MYCLFQYVGVCNLPAPFCWIRIITSIIRNYKQIKKCTIISGGRSSDKAIFRSWSDDPPLSDHRTFWILEAKLSDDRFKIRHLEAIMLLHRFNVLSWRQKVASSFPFFQHLSTMSLHRQWWTMSMSMSRPCPCPCLCHNPFPCPCPCPGRAHGHGHGHGRGHGQGH